MNPLFALVAATPIWGFSLQPPVVTSSQLTPEHAAQTRTVIVEARTTMNDPAADARNEQWMNTTRVLQVTTTLAMAVTATFGAIQFHDEYGFHDEYVDTPCGSQNGDPVFDYCGESTPVPHLAAASVTAASLIGTVVVSTQVDFDRAAAIDSDWRIYETTRWLALAFGVVQALAGALLANSERAGWLSYQDDFDLMQALAIGHMAWGAVNLGLNIANSILVF